MSAPYWEPFAAVPGLPGNVVPIQLRNPQMAANAGNSFPTVSALTAWEEWRWEFVQKQLGKVFGTARIPDNWPVTLQRVVLEVGANGTGATRLSVKTYAVVAGASYNPAALNAIAAQVVTISATRTRQVVSFTQAGETWHSGDLILVEVYHKGTDASDTLTVNTELLNAYLQVS